MKLLDIAFGKKKPENATQDTPRTATRKPATMKSKSVPVNTDKAEFWKLEFTETHAQTLPGSVCADDKHDFMRPYPLKCRKFGLECKRDSELTGKYMGNYFDGVT